MEWISQNAYCLKNGNVWRLYLVRDARRVGTFTGSEFASLTDARRKAPKLISLDAWNLARCLLGFKGPR